MQTESISSLKKALLQMNSDQLVDACLRLARFKKDNKGLLTYLLFLSRDEAGYIDSLCGHIDEQFALTPKAHRKTVRKIIRWMDKCLRFSGIKETEVQVRLHFCQALVSSKTPYQTSRVINNMLTGQIKKTRKAMEKFHKDVRLEYEQQIDLLTH